MPISQPILAQHRNQAFVETGTLNGDAVRYALSLGFKQIRTIELDPRLYQAAVMQFRINPEVKCFRGDSSRMIVEAMRDLRTPTTFWLDAHPPGELRLFDPSNPTLAELLEIARHRPLKGSVILIDDLRLFSQPDQEMLLQALRGYFPGSAVDRIDSPVASSDIARARIL